jgi:hypothetical protein
MGQPDRVGRRPAVACWPRIDTWPVAPKIMKFVLTRSLLQDAFEKKSNFFKNRVRPCDAAQNRFGPRRTSSSFRG